MVSRHIFPHVHFPSTPEQTPNQINENVDSVEGPYFRRFALLNVNKNTKEATTFIRGHTRRQLHGTGYPTVLSPKHKKIKMAKL